MTIARGEEKIKIATRSAAWTNNFNGSNRDLPSRALTRRTIFCCCCCFFFSPAALFPSRCWCSSGRRTLANINITSISNQGQQIVHLAASACDLAIVFIRPSIHSDRLYSLLLTRVTQSTCKGIKHYILFLIFLYLSSLLTRVPFKIIRILLNIEHFLAFS